MASGGGYREQVRGTATAREERRVVGGVSYDVLMTDVPAVAEAWVRDLPPLNPSPPLPRVVGAAFSSINRFDGRWVVHNINLSVSNRVLQLRLCWGAASIPAALRGFLRNSSNLFVGDEVEMAADVFQATAGGVWMPMRQDLAPLAASRRFGSGIPYTRPDHEVLARTMLGWPEEHLVQTVSLSRDDFVVQSCVVAQHVGHFLLRGDGGAR